MVGKVATGNGWQPGAAGRFFLSGDKACTAARILARMCGSRSRCSSKILA
jgi:hypothetical protein